MRTIVSVVLFALALSVPLATQTLTEQLQKGIYTEETLRNRDEAARIYRQIIAAPTVPRSIAEEAQRRLARLLLAQPPLAVVLAERVPPAEPRRGMVKKGRYRHVVSGVAFDLPPGWTASDTFPSSDGGDMVTLTETATRRSINVWMIKLDPPDGQIAEHVAGAPAEKLRQRHSGYGIPGMIDSSTYEIPRDTVKSATINGRQAMIAVGQYVGIPLEPGNGRPWRAEGGGNYVSRDRASAFPGRQRDLQRRSGPIATRPATAMREYMTWINAQHSRAFFFARVPVDDLPQLRPAFDQIVNSAVIQ